MRETVAQILIRSRLYAFTSADQLRHFWESLHLRKRTLTKTKTRQSFDLEESLLCQLVGACVPSELIASQWVLIQYVTSTLQNSTNIDAQESAISAIQAHSEALLGLNQQQWYTDVWSCLAWALSNHPVLSHQTIVTAL